MSRRIALPVAAVGILILSVSWYILTPEAGTISRLENIHGIPYPLVDGRWQITEELAHADIYLNRPPLARQLTLTISFIPKDVEQLAVGIRENSFWLSYEKQQIFDARALLLDKGEKEGVATITIPLTDKLPDRDGSVDAMLFASPAENVWWEIADISYTVSPALPTRAQLKDYLRRQLTREIPL